MTWSEYGSVSLYPNEEKSPKNAYITVCFVCPDLWLNLEFCVFQGQRATVRAGNEPVRHLSAWNWLPIRPKCREVLHLSLSVKKNWANYKLEPMAPSDQTEAASQKQLLMTFRREWRFLCHNKDNEQPGWLEKEGHLHSSSCVGLQQTHGRSRAVRCTDRMLLREHEPFFPIFSDISGVNHKKVVEIKAAKALQSVLQTRSLHHN